MAENRRFAQLLADHLQHAGRAQLPRVRRPADHRWDRGLRRAQPTADHRAAAPARPGRAPEERHPHAAELGAHAVARDRVSLWHAAGRAVPAGAHAGRPRRRGDRRRAGQLRRVRHGHPAGRARQPRPRQQLRAGQDRAAALGGPRLRLGRDRLLQPHGAGCAGRDHALRAAGRAADRRAALPAVHRADLPLYRRAGPQAPGPAARCRDHRRRAPRAAPRRAGRRSPSATRRPPMAQRP